MGQGLWVGRPWVYPLRHPPGSAQHPPSAPGNTQAWESCSVIQSSQPLLVSLFPLLSPSCPGSPAKPFHIFRLFLVLFLLFDVLLSAAIICLLPTKCHLRSASPLVKSFWTNCLSPRVKSLGFPQLPASSVMTLVVTVCLPVCLSHQTEDTWEEGQI